MTADHFSLDGKVALITGAGVGIGAGIARMFATAGADVAITARTKDDLDAVAADVEAAGQRAFVAPGDVNDLEYLETLVAETVSTLGGVDILVNNAGGSWSPAFMETTVQQFEDSFHFNISSPFRLSQLCVPHMLERPGANIINIASMAAVHADRGMMVHSVTKAAKAQLTRTMAADLAPRIRVNAVLPGAIETRALNMWLSMLPDGMRDQMHERTRMRRNGVPEDIAAACLYLASDAASFVTGKLLEVDGMASQDLIPRDLPDL